MSTLHRVPALLIVGALLTACTTDPVGYPAALPQTSSSTSTPNSSPPPDSSPIDLDSNTAESRIKPFVQRGSGRLVGTPSEPEPAFQGGDIVLNFDETPIEDVVGIIFGEYLGANYAIDPAVKGSITYRGSRGLAKDELLPVLENLLAARNTAVVRTDKGYRIVPARDAAALAQPDVIGNENTTGSGFRSVIVPLKFISAQDMSEIVRAQGVQTTVNASRNLLVVAGTGNQIRQVKRLVETFDVNWLKGMSFALHPLEHADASEVAQELRSIFLTGADETNGNAARVVSIDRLNAILVVAPHADLLQEYGSWIDKLDSVSGLSGQGLYVYRVQHGRAEDLANVLNEIFLPQITRRLEVERDSDTGLEFPSRDNFFVEQSVAGTLGETGNQAVAARVRVIADKTNNALLILANQQDYRAVESALRRLDVEPLQVLVEASIVEVILGDDLKYGLEWLIRGTSEDYTGDGLLNFGLGDTPGGFGLPPLGPVVPGFSYVIRKAGEVRLALNALAEDSRINVLSSPALMVLNNETATIRVGDEVPIATRSSVSNIDPDAPTVNEIEYRDTGVLLAVTPRVNVGGLISMDIDQEVSNVSETTTSTLDSPTFLQRRITSSVAVDSGETIVLGGLIREQETTVEQGIPGLYKIPVLGKLFGTTAKTKTRTELIVLITPRAIYVPDDMRAVTDEYQRKLIGLAPRMMQELQNDQSPAEESQPTPQAE